MPKLVRIKTNEVEKTMDRIRQILVASALIIALTMPMLAYLPVATATKYDADTGYTYVAVKGLMGIDNYANYYDYKDRHWLMKALDVGFSRFGECIAGDSKLGIEHPSKTYHEAAPVGIEYSQRDPFANERVTSRQYSEGWYLNMSYRSYTYGPRKVWAFALYSDLREDGGDWINGSAGYNIQPYGGRKTSGRAVSDPLEIIYDGPRRFIAKAHTTIYDEPLTNRFYPVIEITTLFVFFKDYKYVMVIDTLSLKVPDVELGMRWVNVTWARQSKWLLGPWPEFRSYVHAYMNTTVYDYTDWGSIPHYPQPLSTSADAWTDGIVVAQIIDRDKDYVGFAAFWPNCTDFAVNATDYWFRDLPYDTVTAARYWSYGPGIDWPNNVWWPDLWDDELHENTEPDIPFIKAQWRFNMSYAAWTDFRTVTLYGVSDFIQDAAQAANDYNMEVPPVWAGKCNALMDEVVWLVFNMTFQPWPDIPRALGAPSWQYGDNVWYWAPEDPATTRGFGQTLEGQSIYTVWHYNWTVVGRDAAVSDVVGAATLVSALDDYRLLTMHDWSWGEFAAALDMEDSVNTNIPSVCYKFGAGYMKSDYYEAADTAAGEEIGDRVGFMDEDSVLGRDFIGTNVTVVGGPYANLAAEYLNDFTAAFALDEPPFNHEWTTIMALTAWPEPTTYVDVEAGDDTGYAVVATYWDLNGTAFLWVWGWTAEDTAAMCQILRDDAHDGTLDFWNLPDGTTAVIVEIDYETMTYDIVETLSPISALY